MARLTDLVLYDGSCGLCQVSVHYLLQIDLKERFVFAPLQGITAKHYLTQQQSIDSLVLIEAYQTLPRTYILAQSVLKIAWLLGGRWCLIGILSFLPGWMFNWAYRLLARHRHLFVTPSTCQWRAINYKERFLP